MITRLLLQRPRVVTSLKGNLSSLLQGLRNSSAAGNSARPLARDPEAAVSFPEVIQMPNKKFAEGNDYHDFQCTRVEHVPEFGIMSYTFKHRKTGTELWYVDRKDQNNAFSINFRTTPFDSTGVPHILEHSVLCGSQKYPVRDPFFKMLTRSVATFMNAMTGADYTMYPFSTMNETDYRNLQGIYLDAVFRPNLEYLDFLQEGWRLEHTDLNDKQSEYVIKGVVYNEMKGAFSDNSNIFGQNLLNNLLPDHTYAFVSGGNPLEIPKLSHANLVDFHRKYYHPSNARIYAYGTFDPLRTMAIVNEEYLSEYKGIDNSYSRVPAQKRWQEPRNVHISSRYDNMGAPFEKQNQIAIAMLLSDITDIQEAFVLHVLSELMLRGPNSTFYKNLIEPNFSGGFNQATGYDNHCKDTFFSVGLQDLRVEDFPRFQQLFEETVQEVIEKGFDPKHVESVIHNLELSLKHQTSSFGLDVLLNSTPLWNHEGDVVQSLHISKMIADFRNKLQENTKFLQEKVAQHFEDNPHRLTLTMSPDDHYEDNFRTAELQLLKEKIIALDHEKREEIYTNGLKLEEAQKKPANVELLPTLTLADVREPRKYAPITVTKIQKVPTQVCNVHTNGITYAKIHFDASSLTKEEIFMIPIFCEVVGDLGTVNHDYREFDKLVHTKTSGIGFRLHFEENIFHNKSYNLGVLMSSSCLDKNVGDMFDLFNELLQVCIDDENRLQLLLDNYMSDLSVGITNQGHLYAMLSAAGLVSDAAQLKAKLKGIEHIEFMKQCVRSYDTKMLMENMKSIGKKLFNRSNMRVAINCSEEFYPQAIKAYEGFLQETPQHGIPSKKTELISNLLLPSNVHYQMNVPVNYCSKAIITVPYTHRDHPALYVLAKLLTAKYLLPVVREQNGAYGAGARIGHDGIFSCFSYRDPKSTQTLEAFDNIYQWLQDNDSIINDVSLFEAKVSGLQQLDAPTAPADEGMDFFLYGISSEMLIKYRARMLSVTAKELKEVAEKYLKKDPLHVGKCILGPENAELESDTRLKWKVIA